MKKYLLILAFAAVVWIIWDAIRQPGVNDLDGDFKEVAFVRNEQNTGPVVRIYAVTLKDTLWSEMTKYGNYMPHTKYGLTRVYFFLNKTPVPRHISLNDTNVDNEFKKYCVALYEKNAMSQVYLNKFPFR